MKSLAIDLARAMLGNKAFSRWKNCTASPTRPVQLPTGLYWDTLRLFHEIRRGLAIAGRERKLKIRRTWRRHLGRRFRVAGRRRRAGRTIHIITATRATTACRRKTFAVVPKEEIFEASGIQFMQINSLYQWYAMKLLSSPALRVAKKLLFLPDLLNYWLTGVAARAHWQSPARRSSTIRESARSRRPMLNKLGLDA